MDAIQRWLTLVTLISAALAAMLYLSRQIWRGFRMMELLASVVEHELTPNTGSSMKDDVAAIAVAVGRLQGDLVELAAAKDITHGLIQMQLDTLTDALDLSHHPQHRGEEY